MQSHILHTALARTLQAERLAARAAGRGARERGAAAAPGVTIRFARPGEGRALARLAALDSQAPPPDGTPVLVAEVAGELAAAVPLPAGELIADPFRPSAAVAELLAVRAEQLRRCGAESRGGRLTPAVAR